jgi:hypothetical protein
LKFAAAESKKRVVLRNGCEIDSSPVRIAITLLGLFPLLRYSQLHVGASSPKFVQTMIFELCAPENQENTRFEKGKEIQLIGASSR